MKRILLLLAGLFLASPAFADSDSAALRTSLAYAPIQQFQTDVDAGGAFSVTRHFLHLDLLKPLSRQTQVGLGVHFDYENWDFTTPVLFAGAASWREVYRPSVSFRLFHSLSPSWRLFLMPQVGLATTTLENGNDGLVYGAALALMRGFGPGRSLGFGLSAFENLEQTDIYPVLLVNWRLGDGLRLQNPSSAGPSGPAGLELVWNAAPGWELGLGGAWRSMRFRLANDNPVADGIVTDHFVAGFARLGRKIDDKMSIDLLCGALFAGELAIEDADGHQLATSGYDSAPFVGLTFKGRF